MKKIFMLAVLLLFAVPAFAQDYPFRVNEFGTTTTGQPNNAPAQAGISRFREQWIAAKPGNEKCSSAVTAAGTPNAIVAAVPSVSHIVSQIICSNTSLTPSAVTILDGATTVHSDYVKAQDRSIIPLPQPYSQVLNSALNVSTGAGASVTCCANYKESPVLTPTPTATATP